MKSQVKTKNKNCAAAQSDLVKMTICPDQLGSER